MGCRAAPARFSAAPVALPPHELTLLQSTPSGRSGLGTGPEMLGPSPASEEQGWAGPVTTATLEAFLSQVSWTEGALEWPISTVQLAVSSLSSKSSSLTHSGK